MKEHEQKFEISGRGEGSGGVTTWVLRQGKHEKRFGFCDVTASVLPFSLAASLSRPRSELHGVDLLAGRSLSSMSAPMEPCPAFARKKMTAGVLEGVDDHARLLGCVCGTEAARRAIPFPRSEYVGPGCGGGKIVLRTCHE